MMLLKNCISIPLFLYTFLLYLFMRTHYQINDTGFQKYTHEVPAIALMTIPSKSRKYFNASSR